MGLKATNPRSPAKKVGMAIYSLNHKALGKTRQKQALTAGAHCRYITRAKACTHVMSRHMPSDASKAKAWIEQQEKSDRKNARVCDKVMLALPKELTAEQQHGLVKDFAEDITQGRVPWLAAFHTQGKDEHNPHCHMVIRDRDHETGRRVLYTSAGPKERKQFAKKGISTLRTQDMRETWAEHANQALEKAGSQERIDHRSLKDQEQEREPTIHEGVRARQLDAKGIRPRSRERRFYNGIGARRQKTRQVDYRRIDRGRTRQEVNADIRLVQSAEVDARAAAQKEVVGERTQETWRRYADYIKQRKGEQSEEMDRFRQRLRDWGSDWEP